MSLDLLHCDILKSSSFEQAAVSRDKDYLKARKRLKAKLKFKTEES